MLLAQVSLLLWLGALLVDCVASVVLVGSDITLPLHVMLDVLLGASRLQLCLLCRGEELPLLRLMRLRVP